MLTQEEIEKLSSHIIIKYIEKVLKHNLLIKTQIPVGS